LVAESSVKPHLPAAKTALLKKEAFKKTNLRITDGEGGSNGACVSAVHA
jgi:hypothetical protein